MGGEEKRHEMMQNLFGDQSEEEEEIDSEHESNPHPTYASDEAEGELRNEVDDKGEGNGYDEAEVESDGEMHEAEPDPGESEGEREASSQEVDVVDRREESEGSSQEVDVVDRREESEVKESDSDEKEDYGQRVVTSRRGDVVDSGSEKSEEQRFSEHDDEEVDEARSPSRSSEVEKDQTNNAQSAAEIRHVFGESDEEEEEGYAIRNDVMQDSNRSPMEEEDGYERVLRPEDLLAEDDARYESEEENIEMKSREKPVGPPLEIELPFRQPPADSAKMYLIKVSNIMGIDPHPFDPKTYVEEKTFVTDESGAQKRIRLENNIVRWRRVVKPDGTESIESNARFVRWSDGSIQLLIGNEVLDISEQDAQHDQSHLFLRHNKSLLQSQGRILRKMRFMPSSLSSNSHRLLTALVDSRHRKVYKVKNCITDIDPEREKEEKEKALNQSIKANVLLNRKKEKVTRKYTSTMDRRRQLSPGFLEDALDEDDEPDYYDTRRSQRLFDEDLEVEARAERRINNAKKGQRSSLPPVRSAKRPVNFSDSEREESEYESDGDEEERSPPRKRVEELEPEYEEDEEEEYEEDVNEASEEEVEAEEPKRKGKGKEHVGSSRKRGIESDEDSPPRKMPTHRRMAVVFDSDEE